MNLQCGFIFQNNAKVNVNKVPEDLFKKFLYYDVSTSDNVQWGFSLHLRIKYVMNHVNHDCFFAKKFLTCLNKNPKENY